MCIGVASAYIRVFPLIKHLQTTFNRRKNIKMASPADPRDINYRHSPLLMRFLENCSLLLKLVTRHIGVAIQTDLNVEYGTRLNEKWLKVTQRFTCKSGKRFHLGDIVFKWFLFLSLDLVDYADSYDSDGSDDSDGKFEFDDILKFTRLIRKSLREMRNET